MNDEQRNELELLESMYPETFEQIVSTSYQLRITSQNGAISAVLKFSFPQDYLSDSDRTGDALASSANECDAHSEAPSSPAQSALATRPDSSHSEHSNHRSSLPRVRVEVDPPSKELEETLLGAFADVCAQREGHLSPVMYDWIARAQEDLNHHETTMGSDEEKTRDTASSSKAPESQHASLEESIRNFMSEVDLPAPDPDWKLSVYSIGKKREPPSHVRKVFDCRCINNPARHLNLKKLTGKTPEVQWNVVGWNRFEEFFKGVVAHIRSNDIHAVAFRCMKGRHRSVALAELTRTFAFPSAMVQHLELSHGPIQK